VRYKNENNIEDQPLVEKVLSGDNKAFSIVIKNTEVLVTQIVFKMLSVAEDRKDIVQDIYLKAFQKLGSFKFKSKLSTWIGKIAYNTCINHIEKKKLLLIENVTDEIEPDGKTLAIMRFHNEPENMFFNKELSGILKTAIDKLSPVYRTLITLYHNEDLSYSEIAEITELPEGTVKNYLFRARRILRNHLLLTYKKEAL
jgi:RNA polymerase sigma-70 factor (ECF subfamily)